MGDDTQTGGDVPPGVDPLEWAAEQEASRRHQEELAEANAKVYRHPFAVAFREIERLAVVVDDIFVPNARELLALLEASSTNTELAIELVQNVRRSLTAEAFRSDLARCLHNYLASAYSVRENVRTILDRRAKALKRVGDPVAEAFEGEKKRLIGIPEVSFMTDLRNFTQHYGQVPLDHRIHVEQPNKPDAKMESEVTLNVGTLLQWKRWSPASREFLRDRVSVDLRPAAAAHADHYLRLNRWLIVELAKANEPLRSEHEELIVKTTAELTGLDLERARQLTDWTTQRRESTEIPTDLFPPSWNQPNGEDAG